jgi:hypothetical protein
MNAIWLQGRRLIDEAIARRSAAAPPQEQTARVEPGTDETQCGVSSADAAAAE